MCFYIAGDMFSKAQIVGSMKPRWNFNPAYMHTFGKKHIFIYI